MGSQEMDYLAECLTPFKNMLRLAPRLREHPQPRCTALPWAKGSSGEQRGADGSMLCPPVLCSQ